MLPAAPPADVAADERRIRLLAWWSALACLLARLPFVAHRLWDHDSVQFALGAEHYDLAAHHPHPPGYPLYIALLKILGLLGVGPGNAMVALTLVAAACGAFCLPWLVRALWSAAPGDHGADSGASAFSVALFASALYIFQPILWFYGELPLLYAVEGGLTVVLAWAVARMPDGRWALVRAAALLALAAGLRPSSLALLAPLFAFGWFRARRAGAARWGDTVLAGAVGGALILSWALPLFAAAGGYAAWKAIGDEHFRTLLPMTSILYGAGVGALRHNTLLVAKWAAQGLFPGAAVLAIVGVLEPGRLRAAIDGLLRPFFDRSGFLLAWALPAMAFFALFHITKAGYTLVHLPALLVALAFFAAPWLPTPRRAAWAAAAVSLLGVFLYLAGADRVPGAPAWQALWRTEFHPREIRDFERELDAVRALAEREAPATTALVTVELEGRGDGGAEGFLYPWHRHLQWYLPEFTVLSLVPEESFALVVTGHKPLMRAGLHLPVPPATRRLLFVLGGDPDARFVLPPGGEVLLRGQRFFVYAAPLPADHRLGSFELDPRSP